MKAKAKADDVRQFVGMAVSDLEKMVGIESRDDAIEGTVLAAAIWANGQGWSEAKFKNLARRALARAKVSAAVAERTKGKLVIVSDTVN